MCGTLGAPADIANVVILCPHSNLEFCLQQGIQICETVSGSQDPKDFMSLELYLNGTQRKFNATVKVADYNEVTDCSTRQLNLTHTSVHKALID